ncbi:MAG: helicase-associated domain-containing protein [Planctomycetes bacterium]|nr:helicase-associated domain-containing protein [Planctomycetota bacterium]
MRFDERDNRPGPSGRDAEPAPADAPKNGSSRPRIEGVLESRSRAELEELYRFWGGPLALVPPPDPRELRRQLAAWMNDPELVEARAHALGKRQLQVLGFHLEHPAYSRTFEELGAHKTLAYLAPYDLENALGALMRHAFLVEAKDARIKTTGSRLFSIPEEIGDGLLRRERQKRRGLFDALTLRGFLDRMYDSKDGAKRASQTRLREMYKMYANETACIARIERLPSGQPNAAGSANGSASGAHAAGGASNGIKELVEKAILQFGGLLPRAIFERMESGVGAWDGRKWKHTLEESLIGSVERLELSRYGIQHADEVLIVFNEVALAYYKRVAVPGDPDRPHSESAQGVDLVSNISRFVGYILEHDVRFTVRGEIFKTTEKRILSELIPNPGPEQSREEVLAFIFHFARAAGLIESTGERTFALTAEGRHWEVKSLDQKLAHLVEYTVEEREHGMDHFHQMRMRRILLRLLKRVEPGTWYDLMYLPFLARNTYLSNLDQLAVEDYFAARAHSPDYAPMEDLQRLAWNVARWIRTRLYVLGIVDLGYDSAHRPVALRLTKTGARLLGVGDGVQQHAPAIGSLIVTPDFEVVLFPTGDDDELTHELDRFCTREKVGSTIHFRISEKSVHRALHESLQLSRILATLRDHSRTPVPQNVLFSIRDWASRAGVLFLDQAHVVRCEEPEMLRRFAHDPAVKPYVKAELDEKRVQLSARFSVKRLQALLRDLGHLVELE